MKNAWIIGLVALALHLTVIPDLQGQAWNFIREKDHIKLFTRVEGNSSLKSFRGIMDIKADIGMISAMIGNPKDLEWWGKDVRGIRVLNYREDQHIQYYLIYDAPWPFTDRDLVADVQISTDPLSGTRTIYSRPLQNAIPENPGLVRVKKYWQKWTVQPLNNGMIHLTLEGFIDPAGNIPAWLYNMIVVDTPHRLLREVQKRVKSSEVPK
jgi:hypothetical protein